MARFRDIPQFIQHGSYEVHVPLDSIPRTIKDWTENLNLQMCPDFQRGHVWTEEQQVAYVEFVLRGGKSGLVLYFNHPGWHRLYEGEFVLVDGLQRLTACLRFLNNEIPAFGTLYREYTDKLDFGIGLKFNVNDLKTRTEVLTWYLEMNSGGTPHTSEELARVRALLEAETGASK